MNAEICSQGEGRSTSIKVKNLDVAIWTNVVVTLAKGDLEYSYLLDTLAPEGRKFEISTPTPHLLLKSCANC